MPELRSICLLASLISLVSACSGGGADTFTVSVSSGTGGSHVSPSSISVRSGATTSFTLMSSTGYEIASVSGCGGALTGSRYTTGPITAECSINTPLAIGVEGQGGLLDVALDPDFNTDPKTYITYTEARKRVSSVQPWLVRDSPQIRSMISR